VAERALSRYASGKYGSANKTAMAQAGLAVDFAYVSTVHDAKYLAEECRPSDDGIRASDLEKMEFEELRWIVPGILPEGLSLLVGKPKVFKSWMSLDIAAAVASGGEALGSCCEQGPVVYLALEDSARRLMRRMRTTLPGGKWPKDLHFFTRWAQMDATGELPGLAEKIEKLKPRFIVIDTLAKIRNPGLQKGNSQQYSDDYRALAPLQELAADTKTSILIIHHKRKAGSDDVVDTASGSTGLTGAADGMLFLDKPRNSFEGRLEIVGRDMLEDLDLAMTLDPQTCKWKIVGLAEEVMRSREQQMIYDYLKECKEELTPREIASELRLRVDSTRRSLRALSDRDMIVRDKRSGRCYIPSAWSPT
jgi:predicted transcriptional regulator